MWRSKVLKLDNAYNLVKDFHKAFGHPTSESPILLDDVRVAKRSSWMQEELDEFKAANDIYEQADAMIDLIYFCVGTLVEMGIEPSQLFEIVHNANMKKLWPDGNGRWAKDGKTIKPPYWTDPRLEIMSAIDNMSK